MIDRTRIVVTLLLLATVLALGGCADDSTAGEDASMEETGSMMGGVWGYVAAPERAQLEVAEEQPSSDAVLVDRVLAPEDAWLVVHREVDGKPGDRVGFEHVSEGVSTDVDVELEGVRDGDTVIVAVHADRGTPNTFDFDMEAAEQSADRPFFVDRNELAAMVMLGKP